MVLFVLKIFFWIFLILVSFLVFWRTLTPLNVQVWLLDWYYLVTWLRWPDGSAETAVFWSPAWEAGLSVGFCWLSQKPLARAECVFVPGTVCKDRLSWTCCFRVILGVYDWSPWCSSWEDRMCLSLWKRTILVDAEGFGMISGPEFLSSFTQPQFVSNLACCLRILNGTFYWSDQ